VLFHAMKQLHLDKLAVAGGDGAQLLRTAKRVGLKNEDRLALRSRTRCVRRRSRRTPKGSTPC
jgi:hypothetical protein